MKKRYYGITLLIISLLIIPIQAQQSCIGISGPSGGTFFLLSGSVISINGTQVTIDMNNGTFDLATVVCGNNIASSCSSLNIGSFVEFIGVILPQECSIFATQKVRFRATSIN